MQKTYAEWNFYILLKSNNHIANNFLVYGNLLLNLVGLFFVFEIKVLVNSLIDMPFWGFVLIIWYLLAIFVFSLFIWSLFLTWRYIKTGKRTKRNVFVFFINLTPLIGIAYFWLDDSETLEIQKRKNSFSEVTIKYKMKVVDTVKLPSTSVDSFHMDKTKIK